MIALLGAGCSGNTDQTSRAPGTAASAPATSPSAPPSAPSAAPPTATDAPRPKPGTCHRLTFDEVLSPTAGKPALGCKQTHTAETYAVGTVANLADGHLLAVDSRQVQRQVATTCPNALPDLVGGSLEDLRLSMLRPVWFTPTVEEYDSGSDWYRCDVVALAGADRLTRVRGSLAGILETEQGRETYAMCGTAGPDDADFQRVPCSDPHSWRALSVIALPEGDYPGRAAVASAGEDPCRDAAAQVADDPLDYTWAFEGPDPAQWTAGQTFIRCWTPD
ncbi:MAG: septum formation family protein [Nocardioides sp.]